jgi:hypothetical protein
MSVRVEVICFADDGSEQRRQVVAIERRELTMETLGLTLAEAKTLLAGVQDFVVAEQARAHLEQQRACSQCGQRHSSKETGHTPVKTVFGQVQVPNPRWNRCACQSDGPKTFRPLRSCLQVPDLLNFHDMGRGEDPPEPYVAPGSRFKWPPWISNRSYPPASAK